VGAWDEYSVRGVAYHSHLYTQIILGKQTDQIERWFGKMYETPAKEPIVKAISDRRLHQDDWRSLIRFLAAQDVRTPYRLIEHLRRANKQLPTIIHDILSTLEERLKNRALQETENEYSSKEIKGLFPLAVSINRGKKGGYSEVRVETTPGRSTWLFGIKHLLENTANILHRDDKGGRG